MVLFFRNPQLGAALFVLAMCASTTAWGAQKWAFDIHYDIDGIAQTFPAYQRDQCLSEAAPAPDIFLASQQCKTEVHGRFGNTLTWQVDCSSDWEIVQGVGRLTFDGASAGGEVRLQIVSPVSAPQYMVFHIDGKSGSSCALTAAANVHAVQR